MHVDVNMASIAGVKTALAQLFAPARPISNSLAPKKLEACQTHVATPHETYLSARAVAERTLSPGGVAPTAPTVLGCPLCEDTYSATPGSGRRVL